MKTIKKIPKITFRPAGRVLTFDRRQICSAIELSFTLQQDRGGAKVQVTLKNNRTLDKTVLD